jgi:hypothetical protein
MRMESMPLWTVWCVRSCASRCVSSQCRLSSQCRPPHHRTHKKGLDNTLFSTVLPLTESFFLSFRYLNPFPVANSLLLQAATPPSWNHRHQRGVKRRTIVQPELIARRSVAALASNSRGCVVVVQFGRSCCWDEGRAFEQESW